MFQALPDGFIIDAAPAQTARQNLTPQQIRDKEKYSIFGLLPDEYAIPSDSFVGDLARGSKKRALGLAQLGMEVTGNTDSPYYQDMQQLAEQYRKEGEGTGARGLIGEIVGDPLTAATLPIAPAATTIPKLATVGGVGGFLEGATAPIEQGQDRATQTAISTTAGLVLGPVIGKTMQGAGAVVEGTARKLKKGTEPLRRKIGDAVGFLMKNPDDSLAIELRGIDTVSKLNQAIRSLDDDALRLFKESKRAGLTKEEAFLNAKATQRGIFMTRGQLTQNPALQRLEDQAKQGIHGEGAYRAATEIDKANKAAVRDYSRELLSDVTGNPNAVVDETTTGDLIATRLKGRYQELKQPVQEAYKAGLQTKAKVATDDLADVPDSIVKRLREDGIDWKAAPNFKKDMQRYGRVFKKIVSKEIPFGAEDEIAGATSRIKAAARADAYGLDESATDEMAALDFIRQNANFSEDNFLSFLRSKGGLVDDGGELASRGINTRTMPGLLRKERGGGGLTLDDAAELAQERGYIQNRDINELLDLVDNTLAGKSVTKIDEANDLAVKQGLEQAQRILDDSGIDVGEALAVYRKNAPRLNMRADKEIQKLKQSLSGTKPAFSAIPYAKLERLKQNLNSKALWDKPLATIDDYAKRQEILAYRTAAKEMATKLDDLLVNNALKNPDAAAKELAKAPALNKAFRAAFDKKSMVTRIAEGDLTDKQVADMLGSSVIGKGQSVNFVRELKTALGENADEALGQIRGTMLNRIMNKAYDKGDDATFGVGVKSAIQKLKSGNRQLYDELFTPSQQQAVEEFGDIAFQLSNIVRSKTNPSGSGITGLDGLFGVIRRMGLSGNLIADLGQALSGKTQKEVTAKQAIRSLTEPLNSATIESTVVSDFLRNAGAKPLTQQGAGGTADVFSPPAQPQEPIPPIVGSELPSGFIINSPSVPETIPDQSSLDPAPAGFFNDGTSFTQKNEGLRLATYQDTKGNPTVGYGFNFNSGIASKVWKQSGVGKTKRLAGVKAGREQLTPQEAEALFRTSYAIAKEDAQRFFPEFGKLSPQQQQGLIDLSYHMGLPALKRRMPLLRKALKSKDRNAIVKAFRTNSYAKEFPERSKQIANLLISE